MKFSFFRKKLSIICLFLVHPFFAHAEVIPDDWMGLWIGEVGNDAIRFWTAATGETLLI